MKIKGYAILVSLFIVVMVLYQGCFLLTLYEHDPYTGDRVRNPDWRISFPVGKKKLKRSTLRPPLPFMTGLKAYRVETNAFPIDLTEFKYHSTKTGKAMKSLKEAGYKNLKIAYWSLDSFRLIWDHPPVYVQKLGTEEYAFDASGVFIFTYKDSSFETRTEFK